MGRNKSLNLGTIDLANLHLLPAEQQAIIRPLIFQFLTKNKAKGFFTQNTDYVWALEGEDKKIIQYEFQLKQDVFYRPSEYKLRHQTWLEKKAKEFPKIAKNFLDPRFNEDYFDRFEIIKEGGPISRGGYSEIFEVECTFSPNVDKQEFDSKSHINRIVKLQKIHGLVEDQKEEEQERIERETKFNQRFEYAGVKSPVKYPVKYNDTFYTTFFTVMHKLPGKKFIPSMPFDNKIKLIILLLKAANLVHAKNIIHHDFKLENFRVDLDNNIVYAIDFGVSKDKDEQIRGFLSGTRGYMPWEQQQEQTELIQTDEKSDVYALGIIAESIVKSEKDSPEKKYLMNIIQNEMQCTFQKSRPDINTILQKFERFAIEKKINVPNVPALVVTLNEEAEVIKTISSSNEKKAQKKFKIINVLDDLVYPAAIQAREDYEFLLKSGLPQNDSKDIKSRPTLRDAIKKIFDDSFDKLTDYKMTPEVIKFYFETVGIKAFSGLSCKEDILNKIDDIFDNFEKNTDRLFKMAEIFEKMESHDKKNMLALTKEIPMHLHTTRMIDKYQKYDFSLDNLVELNQKYINYLETCKQYELDPAAVPAAKPNLSNIAYLLCQLNPDKNSSPHYLLIELVKEAMIEYIQQTLTSNTAKNKQRAASQDRISDMYAILKILEKNIAEKDPKTIVDQINTRLAKFEKGLFKSNAFFKFIGNSELKNKIQSAIKRYEILNAPKAAANDAKFSDSRRRGWSSPLR